MPGPLTTHDVYGPLRSRGSSSVMSDSGGPGCLRLSRLSALLPENDAEWEQLVMRHQPLYRDGRSEVQRTGLAPA